MFVKMQPIIDKTQIKLGEIYYFDEAFCVVKEVNYNNILLAHLNNLYKTVSISADELAGTPNLIERCMITKNNDINKNSEKDDNDKAVMLPKVSKRALSPRDIYRYATTQDRDTFDKIIQGLAKTDLSFEDILKSCLDNKQNNQ